MNPNLQKARSDFLITGTSSGLGKYLCQQLDSSFWNRQTTENKKAKIKHQGTEVIIHCAFNSDRNPENLDQYFKDNVSLTEELIKIPHKKFIFISSVDVYPKNLSKHSEDEMINIDKIDTLYGKTKFMSEQMVTKNCSNFLILRCSALLGKNSRKNSLIKIIEDENPALTLSSGSTFNYILHSDVLEFIQLAVAKDLQGIYNLASATNITLSQVARELGKQVQFGDYIYNVGDIDNTKAAAVYPAFKNTSQEVILYFLTL